MTTKSEISEWYDRGIQQGAAYMIVVCDTFSYEDYPVYAKDAVEAREEYARYNEVDMQRVMEVYDLHASKGKQLAEDRAFHLPGGR